MTTKQLDKFLHRVVEIRADRLQPKDMAFMARQLVQATLPHSNPGNKESWERTNGNLTLVIRPGLKKDLQSGERKTVGFPYGTIPRLLLFWLTTEALRTKSRRLELGDSLAAFTRAIGLNPLTGGGKRGDTRRLQEQMERLFRATISFEVTRKNEGEAGYSWLDMQVAPMGELWWDFKQPEQPLLWKSWIELGEKFYESIVAAPVPVDVRALKALKGSSLALDLYAWATYTVFQARRTGKVRSISWEQLQKQFGSDYKEVRNFQTKAMLAFRKIQAVYPEFNFERIRGGIEVISGKTVVTSKGENPEMIKAELSKKSDLKPVDKKSYPR